MLIVNELVMRESMDDRNIHASEISGKVRVSTFTYTVPAGNTDKTVLIAKLPAGRGRALPTISRVKITGAAGNIQVGTLAYTSSMPGVGDIAADLARLSPKKAFTDGATFGLDGAVNGWGYYSLNGIGVIMTTDAALPAGAKIEGILFFNVT